MIQQKISMIQQKISMIHQKYQWYDREYQWYNRKYQWYIRKQNTDTMENTKDISIYNIKYHYGNKWNKMTRSNMENTVREINKMSRTRWYFQRLNCVYFLNYVAFKYLALSVPDEGYSRNAAWALNLISTFLCLILCNTGIRLS
jgi:hypothetical protein